MICLCLIVVISLVCCNKENSNKKEQNPVATQENGEQRESPITPEYGEAVEDESWNDGPGTDAFYPDISFYENLAHFEEYLESLHRRTPYSFSFQVPPEVRAETVTGLLIL